MVYTIELSFVNEGHRYCYEADNPIRMVRYLLKKWDELHEQYDFDFAGGIASITGDYTIVFNLYERKENIDVH